MGDSCIQKPFRCHLEGFCIFKVSQNLSGFVGFLCHHVWLLCGLISLI